MAVCVVPATGSIQSRIDSLARMMQEILRSVFFIINDGRCRTAPTRSREISDKLNMKSCRFSTGKSTCKLVRFSNEKTFHLALKAPCLPYFLKLKYHANNKKTHSNSLKYKNLFLLFELLHTII